MSTTETVPEKVGDFIIYKVTNLVNEKIYIGQTIHTIQRRKREHINNARGGSSMALYRAMRKYGTDNFVFEPICYCTSREEASSKEIEMIKLLNSKARHVGYNMTDGGEGANGCHPSEETRAKMRAKILSPETKEKIRRAGIGRRHTEETKIKMSKAQRGHIPWTLGTHLTEEVKNKLSKVMKRRILPKETQLRISAAVSAANARRVVTDQQKAKISAANKGRSPWNAGKHISDETKAKISVANKGRKLSEETKEKMRLSMTGNKNGLRCKNFIPLHILS
jgi:group I intron endonuclease